MSEEDRKKWKTELNLKFFDMEQKFIELGELCRDIGRLLIRLQSEG